MADFSTIIQEINEDITTNGVGAITGAKLNEVLRDMIAAVNAAKQDPLTIDAAPTEDSTNPVQSGGVYEALEHKPTIYHITNIQTIPPTIISILRAGDILRSGGEHDSIAVVCKIDNNDIYFVSTDGDMVETFLYRNGVFYDYFAYQLSDLANKVPDATQGDLAGLDSDGNLTDSGIAASDVATTSDLAGKQDTISDLDTIRSGAAAGETAYQKPSGGIPKTDLASGVQTSLGKADTAVQQVTVGTTTTGNAGTNASVTNSGTETAPVLDFTIPRGADGADGQDGADAVNPFKGWYASSNALPANPVVGDYAYVKGANASDPAAIYECTTAGTWSDSGRTADTSNVQTFASGEEVNDVHIVNDLNTGGANDVLSAEQGVELRKMFDKPSTQNYFKNMAIRKYNSKTNRGYIYQEEGWGFMRIPVSGGATVTVHFEAVGADATSSPAIIYTDENYRYLNYSSYSGYTGSRTFEISSGTTSVYMLASFKLTKMDGSKNVAPVELNGTPIYLNDYNKGDDDKWKELNVGGFSQGNVNANGDRTVNVGYDPKRCFGTSKVVLHRNAAKIRFVCNENLWLNMYMLNLSADGNAVVSASVLLFPGDEYTIPSETKTTRFVFYKTTTLRGPNENNNANYYDEITPSDLSGVKVQYYCDESGVVERNSSNEINLMAAERLLAKTIEGGVSVYDRDLNGMAKMPIVAHISDVHGDTKRLRNFMDYCDKYGLDAAINSGDATMYFHPDSTAFQDEISDDHNTPLIFCIGNHESWSNTGTSGHAPVTTLFTDNISNLATKWSYKANSNDATTKCYYYKDFDEKKLRIIALNQYEDGVYNGRFGQAQIQWFISTLQSTPVGYGVVVIMHAPEDAIAVDSNYNMFAQPEPNSETTYQPNGFYVQGRPISAIIDAFISRSNASITYIDHDDNYTGSENTGFTEEVTVTADFSAVDSSIEFICYMCGHRHEDRIGYYEHSTEKQLVLNITCGIGIFGDSTNYAWCDQSDLPRGGEGVSQDAFNVYAIDRYNGSVKVVRVGATRTQTFALRDCMTIPYK